MPPTNPLVLPMIVLASALLGVSVAWFIMTVSKMLFRPLPPPAKPWEVDALRTEKLREGSWAMRWCEPLVDELTKASWLCSPAEEEKLTIDMAVAASPLPWTPRLFLATILCEAAVVAFLISCIGLFAGFLIVWIVLGLIVGGIMFLMKYQTLKTRAVLRKQQIRARFPFAVDLMALMVESGADFTEAIETMVREIGSEAVSRELGLVAQNLRSGRSIHESLQSLADRLKDPDVKDFVDAILRGEKLGVEIASTLRSQADEMLLKRTQRIEEASQQASVHIVYPGFLIMLACLLLVIAPVGLLMRKELLNN